MTTPDVQVIDIATPTAVSPAYIPGSLDAGRLQALETSDTAQEQRIGALEFGAGTGPGVAAALAYTHTQTAPSTVWLISHGLLFQPAAVVVIDHVGDRHHPRVTWPDAATVRLDFLTDVRGTARLS